MAKGVGHVLDTSKKITTIDVQKLPNETKHIVQSLTFVQKVTDVHEKKIGVQVRPISAPAETIEKSAALQANVGVQIVLLNVVTDNFEGHEHDSTSSNED